MFIDDDSEHVDVFKKWLSSSFDAVAKNPSALSQPLSIFRPINHLLVNCGPLRLYKYQRYSERNIRDILSSSIHLASADSLNDKFEGFMQYEKGTIVDKTRTVTEADIEQARQAIQSFFEQHGIPICKEHIDALITPAKDAGTRQRIALEIDERLTTTQELQTKMSDARTTFLCGSLSRSPLSASMWDRYADSHKGFVVGYNADSFAVPCSCRRGVRAGCQGAPDALLCPVLYTNEIPDAGPSLLALYGMGGVGGVMNDLGFLFLVRALCYKSEYWKSEMEWRLITNRGRCDSSQALYAHMEPRSIFLGMDMDRDERQRVIDAALSLGIKNVYQMQIPNNASTYELEATSADLAEPETSVLWPGLNERIHLRDKQYASRQ